MQINQKEIIKIIIDKKCKENKIQKHIHTKSLLKLKKIQIGSKHTKKQTIRFI